MANRVTATQVKVVIDTDIIDSDVTSHIDIANNLVTDLLGSSGLSSTRLGNIELYLSAHFVAIRDQDEGSMVEQSVSDEAGIKYGGSLGKALDFTRYGQQVKLLDTTGVFSTLGMARAQFRLI